MSSPKRAASASESPGPDQKRIRLADLDLAMSSANTPDGGAEDGDPADVSMHEADDADDVDDAAEDDEPEDAQEAEANRARLEQQARKYLAAQTHEVIIPSYAAWFDMSKINKVEERALPEFFNSRNRSKTPQYTRITVDPDTRPSALGPPFTGHFRVIVDTPRGLQPLHPGTTRPPSSSAPENATAQSAKRAPSSLTLRESIYQTSNKSSVPITAETAAELANQNPTSKNGFATYSCDTCGVDCTPERYHSLKSNNFELCPTCYADGRFSSKMFSGDFVRLVSASEFKHADGIHADDWTDAEILLLLEGIEMFEDDWGAVSEHVGTRTKEQCVAQFLQLPIEDEYTSPPSQGDLGPLQYARIPFDKADNPVMSVVAFLAGAVGPGVAAAAAQAGMAELTDSLKRKAVKKAEERGKTEGNEVSTDEKQELQSSTLDESKDPISAPHKSPSAHAHSAVERAAALALSSASVKAQALASHEEEHIRALTSKIVTAQRTKLELKLEQFEAMEELVEEERRGLEEARLALFREKNNLTTQLHELKNLVVQQRQMGGGIPPGFETQFTMLAQSDIPHAHEVSMRGLEYLQGANISHLH
ncbi:hypothetical protein BS47DRAFT_1351167 [Hydnum rufescens UP504]|uniref:SWIRM-domain-containing protein n=1 Tax=Hydnum rufescens UP504 TaxID=1448309 RepID=A0A9P6AL54_9AGAM|nr:hypothetical protein BS47DRAFT_1351167 [Hydnum rufescens UP504]